MLKEKSIKTENAQLFAEKLHILAQIVQNVCEKKYLDESAPSFMTVTQFSILRILNNSNSMTVSELADILQVSKPAASKNVDILYRNRLVNRVVFEKDRRTTSVTLLDKGERILLEYDKVRLQQQCAVLEGFSEDEQDQFAALIEKYILRCIETKEFDSEVICLLCSSRLGEECLVGNQRGHCYFTIKK